MQEISKEITSAIISISGRDFYISKGVVLSTFSLKKEIGDTFQIPVIIAFDDKNQIVNKKCVAEGLVEDNYKDVKVTCFKMKNRTRTRRSRGSRSHCTRFRITKINIGGNK